MPEPHEKSEERGALSETQRATTPLTRDDSLIEPDSARTGDEITRPQFSRPGTLPPHQGGHPCPSAAPSTPPQPGSFVQSAPSIPPPTVAYRSTTRQIDEPPEPTPSPAPQPSGRITPLGWILRGLGLLSISVVSGLLWLAFEPDTPNADRPPNTAPQTNYPFTKTHLVEGQQSCTEVSRGKVQQYFRTHPCQHLTRALYTTTIPGSGDKVLTSVVTVLMPDSQSAAELNALLTRSDTGNINDLSSDPDGPDLPDNYPSLRNDPGYWSESQDRLVVVGESAYFGKSSQSQDPTLKEVTRDALKLGWPQERTPS